MRTWCSHASYSLRLTWSETVLFSVPMRFSKLPTEDCRLSSVEFKLLFSDKILSSTYDQNVSMRAKRLKQKHIVIECFCFGFTRATKANLSWFYRTRFPTRTRLLITAVKTMIELLDIVGSVLPQKRSLSCLALVGDLIDDIFCLFWGAHKGQIGYKWGRILISPCTWHQIIKWFLLLS